jgi:hypothetical protein
MNNFFIFIFLLFIRLNLYSQKTNSIIKELSSEFQQINNLVRDNKIDKEVAQKKFLLLFPKLRNEYYKIVPKEYLKKMMFPLQHFTISAIGGKNGNGYYDKGYNYFDGNKHLAHPAHDIFINDKNFDCKEDKTGKYVSVISSSSGVVIALENKWDSLSSLRGGNYIWIYEPYSNSIFYYAHNNTILVSVGQIVKQGDMIANVGRTGINAFKKRSPTHLHFSYFILKDDKFIFPKNPYWMLMSN